MSGTATAGTRQMRAAGGCPRHATNHRRVRPPPENPATTRCADRKPQTAICARRVRLATICRMRLLCVHRHSLSPSRHQGAIMSQDYAHALGARLRAIRAQQGLSLHGVEEKSEGRWKAVVVGSYE